MRTLWLNLSARCLSWFTGRFNHPTPSDSTPSSHLWCIPTQCAALLFLSGLSPLRSPLLHNPGVHAGAMGFNPMLLPKLDRREIPRSRDRGNSYRSNPGSPSIRGSGSCLRLCRVVFACYMPTGGSRLTPAGAGQGSEKSLHRSNSPFSVSFNKGRWPKTDVPENNSGRECCWPYLIGQHPLSPVSGQKRPGTLGNSYVAQLPPVFGHFMFLSDGLLDYSNRSTWATRTIPSWLASYFLV